MKSQLTLILITSLLITFSLKPLAGEVTKIEINIYTNDGVEKTIIETNSASLTLLNDYLKAKKQSKYYLSSGFGKVKNDVVANFTAGYQLFPNLSVEGGLITSAEIYSVSSSSSTKSGTTGSKSWSMDANAGLKTSTNTSYLLGVNYSVPLPNVTNNIPFPKFMRNVPFPKFMRNLQIDNNLELYSKAGILFWGVDYSLFIDGTITFDGTTYTPNGSMPFAKAKGSNMYFGIGLSYPLTNEASIRYEYSKSKIAGVNVGGFSGSAVFKF